MRDGELDLVQQHQESDKLEDFQKILDERAEYWDTPWIKEDKALALSEEKREKTQEELADLASDLTVEVQERVESRLVITDVMSSLDDSVLGPATLREEELEKVLDSENLTTSAEQTVRAEFWLKTDLDQA